MSTYWKNINDVWETEANAITSLRETISEDTIQHVIQLLGNTKGRIHVSGCGTSGAAAKKIAHTLTCIERPATYINPADAVHGALGVIQPDDILILISKGGNTKELINLIPSSKQKGAMLIAVTENENSIITHESDYLLQVKVKQEPDPFNMLATASTVAVIALFDAICIALMTYTQYTKNQFAIIHPGGAVGDRLLEDKD